jgi:hypothetical protein
LSEDLLYGDFAARPVQGRLTEDVQPGDLPGHTRSVAASDASGKADEQPVPNEPAERRPDHEESRIGATGDVALSTCDGADSECDEAL